MEILGRERGGFRWLLIVTSHLGGFVSGVNGVVQGEGQFLYAGFCSSNQCVLKPQHRGSGEGTLQDFQTATQIPA